uniref:Replicative helicase n=1 Tax=Myoviridae sp. ctiil21 TaxID=2825153 RepID=A0A8S5P6X6_9CAUD|nr:MAG TPA: Replicative helicase [Myoviridae sp. ctiil21]
MIWAARPKRAEILRTIGAPQETIRTPQGLLQAAQAAETKRAHDAACAACPYTVDTCHECRYNGAAFRDERFRNPLLSCIPPCAKYKTQQAQKRITRLMGDGGVCERFRSRCFATFRATPATKPAVDLCRRFCAAIKRDPKVPGLLLKGSYGTGKTHLAVSILRETAEAGIPGMFVVVPDLIAKMLASFDAKDGKAGALVETAKSVPLLVLDDLGAENPKPWVVELVYVLINHRYEHMLPTIITTNYDGKQLDAVFGRRIVSRLTEMTVPVNIRAEDYRMRGVTA